MTGAPSDMGSKFIRLAVEDTCVPQRARVHRAGYGLCIFRRDKQLDTPSESRDIPDSTSFVCVGMFIAISSGARGSEASEVPGSSLG